MERSALVLSSRREAILGSCYRTAIIPGISPVFVPDAPPVAPSTIKCLESKIRTLCFMGEKWTDLDFCAADPDAERVIALMESVNVKNLKEIDILQRRIEHLLSNVTYERNRVHAAEIKLDAFARMGFWVRVKFVLCGTMEGKTPC